MRRGATVSTIPSFFFFAWAGDARDLHSFPTRRSSDLAQAIPCRDISPRRVRASSLPQTTRSEEHTSELQSHHDLVCRLLLEKKNGRYLPRKLARKDQGLHRSTQCRRQMPPRDAALT